MKHFINLTSRVINKLHIIEIVKESNIYYIHISNNSIHGKFLSSSGGVARNAYNIIEICEKNNKQDYDIITNLIKK
jgi:hypothetical protein